MTTAKESPTKPTTKLPNPATNGEPEVAATCPLSARCTAMRSPAISAKINAANLKSPSLARLETASATPAVAMIAATTRRLVIA